MSRATDEGWDVFISHAAEDKANLALPLARHLEERGLRVWLDTQEIDLADSLRGRLNAGIAGSRFAVALLSARYFDRKWTVDELDAFMAREAPDRPLVLPVLHDIDVATLMARYPLLANRMFTQTSKGLAAVADDIARVVLKAGSGSPSQRSPNLGRRLLDILQEARAPTEVQGFLSHHPRIAIRAVGGDTDSAVRWRPVLGDFVPDLCVSRFAPTTARHNWHLIVLATLSPRLFEPDSELVPSVRQGVAGLESLRRWIPAHYPAAREMLPDVTPDFQGVVLAGRRHDLTSEEKRRLEDLNDLLIGVRIRTYDWLVDAALQL